MKRLNKGYLRHRIWAGCLAMVAYSAAAQPAFDPARVSIDELSVMLDSGELTSRALVDEFLRRIERFDQRGPRIDALITVNPQALEEAAERDAERARVPHRGRLYGIPFIVKDNIDTAGIATTGGSAVLAHSIPASNAVVVQRLLDQGAILMGKANLSELAASYGRLGYSSVGGLTRNPYDLARNASGSSSGSAAAVAAGFGVFAIGTDTSGSIRGPASVTGLVGLRPTFGLISRRGVIPSSPTFDAVGILTRTAQDAMIVLAALDGSGPRPSTNRPRARSDDPVALAPELARARLGVITNFRAANAEVDALEAQTLTLLRSRGAVMIPLRLPRAFETLWTSVLAPMSEAEFKTPFERYLRSLSPTLPKSLKQFIDASSAEGIAHSVTPVNPLLLDALRQADKAPPGPSSGFVHLSTEVIPDLRRQLRVLMIEHRLDALVVMTMSCPASPLFGATDAGYVCKTEDPYQASYVASVAGFPEVSVPAGQTSGGLPTGFSFIGSPHSEAKILKFADALQRALPALTAPASTSD